MIGISIPKINLSCGCVMVESLHAQEEKLASSGPPPHPLLRQGEWHTYKCRSNSAVQFWTPLGCGVCFLQDCLIAGSQETLYLSQVQTLQTLSY